MRWGRKGTKTEVKGVVDLWVCKRWKLIDFVDVLEMEKKRMGGRGEQKRNDG